MTANTDMTVREVPSRPWGAVGLGALVVFVLALGLWEWRMRALEVLPGDRENLQNAWAVERRKLDAQPPPPVVIVGSSRILFDTRFAVWDEVTGIRPLMLAIHGTPPWEFLHDIAANTGYAGLVVVGVDPDLFFGTWPGLGAGWLDYAAEQTPAQHSGHALYRPLEEAFGFLDPEYRLFTLLERSSAPQRLKGDCKGPYFDVWKIMTMGADREVRLWSRIQRDEYLREQARSAWCVDRTRKADPKVVGEIIERTRKDVEAIRARGGDVAFIRSPSGAGYLEAENRELPRAKTWDPLIAATGSVGIHFEDYPAMQGLELPEWSHLSDADAHRFTRAYVEALQREMAARGRPLGTDSSD